MVMLTADAATAIRGLTERPDVPEGVGLRISSNTLEGPLTLQLVTSPSEGDAVVQSEGATLFMDEVAAQVLDGKALHAVSDDNGTVEFAITEQPAG